MLQRLVLDYRDDELRVRCLYRTTSSAGPGTKARRREVTTLVRTGLQRALAALDAGDVADLGTSGFETREDTFLCTPGLPAVHKKTADKGAA